MTSRTAFLLFSSLLSLVEGNNDHFSLPQDETAITGIFTTENNQSSSPPITRDNNQSSLLPITSDNNQSSLLPIKRYNNQASLPQEDSAITTKMILPKQGCIQCANKPTSYMISKGKDCNTWSQTYIRCYQDSNPYLDEWTKNKFCQQRCYDLGLGYPDEICCREELKDISEDGAGDSCDTCDDAQTDWMKRVGRGCSTWNLKEQCKNDKSGYWEKLNLCSQSCAEAGVGYPGTSCCIKNDRADNDDDYNDEPVFLTKSPTDAPTSRSISDRFIVNVSIQASGLGQCEGDCDSDYDCRAGLSCFNRSGNEPIPGCYGNARSSWDYCVASAPTKAPTSSISSKTHGHINNLSRDYNGNDLRVCQGDCDKDADCRSGLECFNPSGIGQVPGCSGSPRNGWYYCAYSTVIDNWFTPTNLPTSNPSKPPSSKPTFVPTIHPIEQDSMCNLCTDYETAWMVRTGNLCDTFDLPLYCRNDVSGVWQHLNICSQSCAIAGVGYPGTNCCTMSNRAEDANGSTTKAPTGVLSEESHGHVTNLDRHGSNLRVCQGDCDTDDDCRSGLKCWFRGGDEPVPGCSSGPEPSRYGWDYCIPQDVYGPTDKPTSFPTASPTVHPTRKPTRQPTTPGPTIRPTDKPTSTPTAAPTMRPTRRPTTPGPTSRPTDKPTSTPTAAPTMKPTRHPTTPGPTPAPTISPTDVPTDPPTPGPTSTPTDSPTSSPTDNPTGTPTKTMSSTPSKGPSSYNDSCEVCNNEKRTPWMISNSKTCEDWPLTLDRCGTAFWVNQRFCRQMCQYEGDNCCREDEEDRSASCISCSNNPSSWMIKNGHKCDSWQGLKGKCGPDGNNTFFIEKKFCQYSCWERHTSYLDENGDPEECCASIIVD